jgi:hypothetical protein
MSITLVRAVLAHSRAKLGARLVMLVLAERASSDGVSWPSLEVIAREAGVTVKTVTDALREQGSLGEVEIRKAQDGRRRFNVYRVLLPGAEEVDYERLAQHNVTLREPFAGGRDFQSSGDGWKSTDATGGKRRTFSPRRPLCLNRKEDQPPLKAWDDDREQRGPSPLTPEDEAVLQALVNDLNDADERTYTTFANNFGGTLNAEQFERARWLLQLRGGIALGAEPIQNDARYAHWMLTKLANGDPEDTLDALETEMPKLPDGRYAG